MTTTPLPLHNGLSLMNKIRVALVEDHDLTRFGLRTALQQQSELAFVGEAANGSDGWQLLVGEHPDVAIVDIGLPDMDGIELTAQVKAAQAQRDQPQTKIVILTLQDEEEAVLAAFAAGADSYCMKNISFELLLEAVLLTYEGNAWIDPAIARIVLSQVKPAIAPPPSTATVTITPHRPTPNRLAQTYALTERELEVLQLIVDGNSNADIADKLYITVGTVKTHVRNILNKLCADDRTQAAVRALRSGLVG
jgi:NarL family two-component system response regulator LiaR